MQFLVIARDGTDADALARRLATREAHLDNVKKYKETGEILIGGALLSAEGTMNGSALMVNFADRAALDAYLSTDPYTVNGVWQTFEITEMKVAGL
ncbi:hypothetical protein VZ95_10795 [Elstera litoralis]|uniref:YCII-related domain-containing protein n=1 Tax=Elstera litoralis TaxID=552518 RepID=A0A0F3IVD5_9PROT|nr:YciI family protein [Elstera litoralis]KJV09549.1 hypothetical protein VZ95_10795 [Elstera litoralis]